MYCLMAAHVYVDLWTETGEFFFYFSFSRFPSLTPSV